MVAFLKKMLFAAYLAISAWVSLEVLRAIVSMFVICFIKEFYFGTEKSIFKKIVLFLKRSFMFSMLIFSIFIGIPEGPISEIKSVIVTILILSQIPFEMIPENFKEILQNKITK